MSTRRSCMSDFVTFAFSLDGLAWHQQPRGYATSGRRQHPILCQTVQTNTFARRLPRRSAGRARSLPAARTARAAGTRAARCDPAGRLPVGSTLPASRTLGRELGLARSVVVEAYSQLVAEGYVEARRARAPAWRATTRSRSLQRRRRERRDAVSGAPPSGLPDPASFPRREWLRHYRAVLRDNPTRRSATRTPGNPYCAGRWPPTSVASAG